MDVGRSQLSSVVYRLSTIWTSNLTGRQPGMPGKPTGVPVADRGEGESKVARNPSSPEALLIAKPQSLFDRRLGVHASPPEMRRGGFEPPRPLGHEHLKLASLPVPPPPRSASNLPVARLPDDDRLFTNICS